MSLCVHVADSGPEPPANPIDLDNSPGTARNLNQHTADTLSQSNGECADVTGSYSDGKWHHEMSIWDTPVSQHRGPDILGPWQDGPQATVCSTPPFNSMQYHLARQHQAGHAYTS